MAFDVIDFISNWHYLAALIAGALAGAALLGLWNRALHLRVSARTAELRAAVEQVRTLNVDLARERNLLRLVIDNTPAEIYLKDLEGRYLLMNREAMRLLGVSDVAAIAGRTVRDFFPPAAARAIEEEDREVLASEQAILGRERRRVRTTARWISVSKVPLRDPEGRLTGLLTMNRDVTELRTAMEEARRLNVELEWRVQERTVELEHAARELRAFSYSVSHDLRAPLRRASGFLSMLWKSCFSRLEPGERELVQRVIGATRRMDQLIDDMLRLSQVAGQEIRLGDVDLSRLAAEVAADLRGADPGRKVAMSIADGMRAHADARLVRIILENLIGNAWKFTGRTTAPEIEVGAVAAGGGAVYFVRDNGAGFDMAHAQRLFDPFQRLHHVDQFPGTGVGLATVARIVRRHGGRIWAEARPGAGATFHFTLDR